MLLQQGGPLPRTSSHNALLPKTEQDRQAEPLCHHHTHQAPLPGAPGCDAVRHHSAWELAPKVRGSTGSLRPCMARVLYLASEQGSVEPRGGGRRSRAWPQHCPPLNLGLPPTLRRALYTPLHRRGNEDGAQRSQLTCPRPQRWETVGPSETGPQSRAWSPRGAGWPARLHSEGCGTWYLRGKARGHRRSHKRQRLRGV